MDVQAAARLGDEIAHGFGVAAMLCGAVAGAVIGAMVVAATVATGGIAIVLIGGAVAAGGLSMFQVAKGLSKLFDLPEPTTGVLTNGSPDVYINGRNAMRAGEDGAGSCSGLPLNHPMWPFAVHIAEGSATVYINGKPAARLNSKMVCGAHIKSGSPDTFIGGPTASIAFVLDIESWMHTGLEALGLAAMGSALVLAAMAGAAMLTIAVVVGATTMAGMALLGDLGDRLGPGGRDLLQGIAGMALLGFAPKMANAGKSQLPEPNEPLPVAMLKGNAKLTRLVQGLPTPKVTAVIEIENALFIDSNQRARPRARASPAHRVLISKKVLADILREDKLMPNRSMATAHAEIGAMQQAYEAGLTKGHMMKMTVTGKKVCSYCRSNVVSMAEAAGLESLTIHEKFTGKTLLWEVGMAKLAEVIK
jgi:uncharacterized Zn-binding protein involved in type VI secretion